MGLACPSGTVEKSQVDGTCNALGATGMENPIVRRRIPCHIMTATPRCMLATSEEAAEPHTPAPAATTSRASSVGPVGDSVSTVSGSTAAAQIDADAHEAEAVAAEAVAEEVAAAWEGECQPGPEEAAEQLTPVPVIIENPPMVKEQVELRGGDDQQKEQRQRRIPRKSPKKGHDPVEAGNKLVSEWTQARGAKQQHNVSDRQKGKLLSQGFVTVEVKSKGRRSEMSAGTDCDASVGQPLTAAAAERLKLLERISSGGRELRNNAWFKKRSPRGTSLPTGQVIDHSVIADRLATQKQEKQLAELRKTKVGGGKVAYQSASVHQNSAVGAWASVPERP